MFLRLDSVAESSVYNSLNRNKEHTHCSLIIKLPYKNRSDYALYCAEHDFFFQWIGYDDVEDYKKLGINQVEYPNDYNIVFGHDIAYDIFSDPKSLYTWKKSGCFPKPKTTKVTNYKTGKKTDLWIAYKNNPYRDPSLPKYWNFVEKFI
jgi:hypothetical protein